MLSSPLAGTITIVCFVVFGTFIYPALFRRRAGIALVAVLTVALGFLFYAFDAGTGTAPATSALVAAIWALLPVGTGLLVCRLQRKSTPPDSA